MRMTFLLEMSEYQRNNSAYHQLRWEDIHHRSGRSPSIAKESAATKTTVLASTKISPKKYCDIAICAAAKIPY